MNDDTTNVKSSTSPNITGNSNNEKYYRRLLATANKLASLQSDLDSIADFFSNQTVNLCRDKLSGEAFKYFFETDFNSEHFRKVEEIIWKRIYHDIYKFQKTKRNVITEQDECLLVAHFISGIGFYSNLVIKLRLRYKLHNVHALVDPLNLRLETKKVDKSSDNQKHSKLFDDDSLSRSMLTVGNRSMQNTANCQNNSSEDSTCSFGDMFAKEWALQAIYRSLIYLGDLARYLLELSTFDYREVAFNFYLSASRNQPEYGLPFNQLATLAGDSIYNLHSVTNYMRCCLKSKPFEAAESNMKKLFILNENIYNEEIRLKNYVAKISDVLASNNPSQAAETMVKSIIVIFIKLTSELWSACITGSLDKDSLIEVTHLFFESLREALELEPIVPLASYPNQKHEFKPISVGPGGLEKPKYIDSTIMYEFCCISMMLISKCQTTKPSEVLIEIEPFPHDTLNDLVNTLALNLLHYSTARCHKMVTSKVQELRITHQHKNESISTNNFCLSPRLNKVFKSKTQSMATATNGDDDFKQQDAIGNNDNYIFMDRDDYNSVMKDIYSQTYLPTIKIFCDWLLANSEIIELNLQSFHSFCSDLGELSKLLRNIRKSSKPQANSSLINSSLQSSLEEQLQNNFLIERNSFEFVSISSFDLSLEDELVYKHFFDGPSWKQKYPLSCDYPLQNLKPLQSVHKLNIDFNHRRELDGSQSGYITIQCIEAFLYALTMFLKNKTRE